MKKILSLVVGLASFMMFLIIANAATTPEYDASYNNQSGAVYANGTNIVISENSSGNTVVTWENGSIEVPSTVSIFGGGKEGSFFTSSNINMVGGTVSYIYGGGISLVEDNPSTVSVTKVVINDGTVLGGVFGGGLIYAEVDTSNVIINDGLISSVSGGGAGYSVISGVEYNAGTEDDAINSKNRVEVANVIINGGTINSERLNYGLVYGGGQGYSYTGNVNLAINGGDMSKAYVTLAGSNGYTKNATAKIDGGDINILQSVNRGTLVAANTKVTGGSINNLYIGGESEDSGVTGIVEKSNVEVLGGNIENLKPGTSGGNELNVEQENYKAVIAKDTVKNSTIGDKEVVIDYLFKLNKDKIDIRVGESELLLYNITTLPAGYENLFSEDDIKWSSSNSEIASVDESGVVVGENKGDAIITASLLKEADSVDVTVNDSYLPMFISGVIIAIILCIIIFGILMALL